MHSNGNFPFANALKQSFSVLLQSYPNSCLCSRKIYRLAQPFAIGFSSSNVPLSGTRTMSPRPCLRRESAQEIDDGELLPLQQQHQQQQQQSRNNSKSLSIFPNSARKSLSPSPQHRSNFLSPSASLYKSAPGM